MTTELTRAFHRSVDNGTERLERSWPGLLATGAVGGLDLSVGVLALLIVEHATHNPLLGSLAFGLGFVALTLASSELFTENFIVPVTAVVAAKVRWPALPRLWFGAVVANLAGGWLAMALIVMAFPDLRPSALHVAAHPATIGIDAQSFAAAVLGGLAITLMTWMEQSTESMPARLAVAVGIAFVLAAGPLLHSVVTSLEMFAALQVGAPFGYIDWFTIFLWAVLGNLVGGLGLVTVLRLVQVGADELEKERKRPRDQPRDTDDDA